MGMLKYGSVLSWNQSTFLFNYPEVISAQIFCEQFFFDALLIMQENFLCKEKKTPTGSLVIGNLAGLLFKQISYPPVP